jgi:hypothetical protein
MKIVLRAALTRYELRSTGGPPEVTRRRGITFSPSGGSLVILDERTPSASERASASAKAPALA